MSERLESTSNELCTAGDMNAIVKIGRAHRWKMALNSVQVHN